MLWFGRRIEPFRGEALLNHQQLLQFQIANVRKLELLNHIQLNARVIRELLEYQQGLIHLLVHQELVILEMAARLRQFLIFASFQVSRF